MIEQRKMRSKKGLFFVLLLISFTIIISSISVTSVEPLMPLPPSEIKGYLLEYQDPPLGVFSGERDSEILSLKKQIENIEKNNGKSSDLELLRNSLEELKATKQEKINSYSTELKNKHNEIKAKISSKISPEKIKKEFTKPFNGVLLDITKSEALDLKNSIPEIKAIHTNYKVNLLTYESIPLINADDVWKLSDSSGISIKGHNISIGIIDTGVDYTHLDLGGCLGADCKVVGGYDYSDNDANPMDYHGHGTHVAATAAGNGALKGVAPEAKIYALKVFPLAYTDVIISAINYSMDPNGDDDFSDHLDIISLSLGGLGNPDDPMSQAIDSAVDVGVVAVVAAGNSGPGGDTFCRSSLDPTGTSYSVCSPGTARKAITVAASDKLDEIASFSGRGPVDAPEGDIIKPDITAPGVSICAAQWNSAWESSKCYDEDHVAISGTSMATPHVSGLVALMIQAHPEWTPSEIKSRLKNTAVNLGYTLYEQGYGRIEAFSAINTSIDNTLVSVINSMGILRGQVNIQGNASGSLFSNYSLYYGLGREPSSWTLLNFSTSPKNGIIGNWNTLSVLDGVYTIKLEVKGNTGNIKIDKTIVIIDNYQGEIISPHGILQGGLSIPIMGNANGTEFLYYRVYYSTKTAPSAWLTDRITLQNGGTVRITNGLLATFNATGLDTNIYNLKIEIYSTKGLEDTKTYENSLFIDRLLLPGWPKNTDTAFGVKDLTTEDIDFDGKAEIIATHYEQNGKRPKVFLLDEQGQLLPGWPIETTSGLCASTGELDGDTEREIIVTASNWVLVLNKDGSFVPGWPKRLDYHWIYIYYRPCPVIMDLNGDKKDEIIIPHTKIDYEYVNGSLKGMPKGQITILTNTGANFPGWPIKFNITESWAYNSPAIGDIDNDNAKEIVFRGLWENDTIFVFSLNGALEKTIGAGEIAPENASYFGSASPILLDWDKDGYLEIIDFYGMSMRVHNYTGAIEKGFPLNLGEYGYNTECNAAVADINKDSYPEIVIGYKKYIATVLAINYTGGILRKITGERPGGTYLWPTDYPSPLVADFDGDPSLEVFFNSGGFTEVNLWDFNGSSLPGWPRPYNSHYNDTVGPVGPTATPSINDINGDGKLEFVLGTTEGYIFAWGLNTTYNKSRIEWGSDLHDPQHTGIYNFTPLAPPKEVHCLPGQIIGDLDNNGIINSTDSSLASEILGGTINMPSNICCIDVNQDDIFTYQDAQLIAQIAQGTAQSPGVCLNECIDSNSDGKTNVIDLALSVYWQNKDEESPDWSNYSHLDYTFDGKINIQDFFEAGKRIGQICA